MPAWFQVTECHNTEMPRQASGWEIAGEIWGEGGQVDKLTNIQSCKEEQTVSEKGCDTHNGAQNFPYDCGIKCAGEIVEYPQYSLI